MAGAFFADEVTHTRRLADWEALAAVDLCSAAGGRLRCLHTHYDSSQRQPTHLNGAQVSDAEAGVEPFIAKTGLQLMKCSVCREGWWSCNSLAWRGGASICLSPPGSAQGWGCWVVVGQSHRASESSARWPPDSESLEQLM